MRSKKLKKMLIFVIALMIVLCVNNVAYASDIQKGEYSKKYQEWLKLSDEEKEKTMPPLPINIRESSKNSNTSDITSKLFKATSLILSNEENIPEKYDLRDYIDIEVKNQMSASQCWAFSANSSIETFLALHNKVFNFSERHMDYDTSSSFIEGPKDDSLNRDIRSGGYVGTAFTYYSRGSGPVLEEDMPFKNHENLISQSELPVERTIQKVDNMVYFPNIYKSLSGNCIDADGNAYSDEEVEKIRNDIKKHIMINGGITTSIVAPLDENYYNSETHASYFNDPYNYSNHAVTIIGWDDTYSRDNFVIKPTNDGAYIVLNSYGTEFGENGIYYISYEDVLVESQMRGITSISDVNYDQIYQYDNCEMYNYIESEYAANMFTADNDVTLTEIMIGCMSNQKGDIYISKDGLNINTATKIVSNVELKAGYNTIKIEPNIQLQSGEQFAIIVKLLEEYKGIGIEDSTSSFARVTSKQNESFISKDGINWEDVYDENNMVNFSIKAFTKKSSPEAKITAVKYSTKNLLEGIGGNAYIYLKTTVSYEGSNPSVTIYNSNGTDVTSQFNIKTPKIENTMSKIDIEVSNEIPKGKYAIIIKNNSEDIATTEIIINSSESIDNEYIRIHFPDINLYNALKEKNILSDEKVLAFFDETQDMILMKDIKELDLEGTFTDIYGYVLWGMGYNVEDLTGIENLSELNDLNVSANTISDLSPISNLTNLKRLVLYGNKGELENLNDLKNLENLTHLEAVSCKIKDISALSNLTKLETLDLQGNEISDISALENLRELNYLALSYNKIKDISSLKNLVNLKQLYLVSTELTNVSNLESLVNITELWIAENKITDISFLENYNKIETLNLSVNPLSNIDILQNLESLKNINMDYCKVSDISALKNLNNLEDVVFACQTLNTNIENVNQDIEIPKLFQDAYNNESLAYSEEGIELKNCHWIEEGKTIRMDEESSQCVVRISSGHAYGSVFTVKLNDVDLDIEKIEILLYPESDKCIQGQEVDLKGGILLVKYNDGTEKMVDMMGNSVKVSNYEKNKIGLQEVNINYEGYSVNYLIDVLENKPVEKIEIIGPNTEFFKGEEIRLISGYLHVVYKDGTECDIPLLSSVITILDYDSSKLGEQTIKVGFLDVYAELKVDVIENNIVGLEISEEPVSKEFLFGEKVAFVREHGGFLTARYNDGNSETVWMGDSRVTISNFDPNKLGTQIITINYRGASVEMTINIVEKDSKKVESIQIKDAPSKTVFNQGEKVKFIDGSLIVKYSDGSEDEVSLQDEGITILNYDSNQIGEQKITINFKGATTEFNITVIEVKTEEKEISNIEIATNPDKLEYKVGEELDFSGGEIVVIYTDDTQEIIPFSNQEIICSGYNPGQLGEQTIIINYRGATTELKINVIEQDYCTFLPYLIARDIENNYLENIKQGTTCQNIIDSADTNGRIEIYKNDKLVEDLNEKLATGMIVKVIFTTKENSYKIIVTGDINGDADVDELDLLMLARYNAGYEKETQMVVNEYLRATNLYKDDDFGDVLDLLKLARILVNLDEF